MKNEFISAITALAAEKNLPKELVLEAVEAALASAYKKDELAQSNVVVKINTEDGSMAIYTQKTVVEEEAPPAPPTPQRQQPKRQSRSQRKKKGAPPRPGAARPNDEDESEPGSASA